MITEQVHSVMPIKPREGKYFLKFFCILIFLKKGFRYIKCCDPFATT